MIRLFTFILLLGSAGSLLGQEELYLTRNGYVHFISRAPLETIEAESRELAGVINPENNEFAFSLDIKTFEGFNSPLQQEHFYENYMETAEYPKSVFTGKIIEEIDYSENKVYKVRAKGTMTVHGEKHERIIDGTLEVKDDKLVLKSNFSILLDDYSIYIPRIVRQKISEEIEVTVNAELQKKS